MPQLQPMLGYLTGFLSGTVTGVPSQLKMVMSRILSQPLCLFPRACSFRIVATVVPLLCYPIVVIMSWWRAQHSGTQRGHVIAEGWVHAREHVREVYVLSTQVLMHAQSYR